MGRNLHKLPKIFDDVIIRLILRRHQNVTAEKVEGFRGFWLLRFKIISLNLPLTPNFSLIHPEQRNNEDFPLPWLSRHQNDDFPLP